MSGIAQVALSCPSAYLENGSHRISSVTISLAKPSAIMFASSAEVRITRTPADYSIHIDPTKHQYLDSPDDAPARHYRGYAHVAALALGSNLGDRVSNIEKALVALEANSVHVLNTSFMYESDAMYVEDQPKFANAACLVTEYFVPGYQYDPL